jgi:hypothetical protein
MLQAMESFLQDPEVQVRSSVVYYVGFMEGRVSAEERARALIWSAVTLEAAENIKRPMGYYDGEGERWTQLELAVDDILRSLARLLHVTHRNLLFFVWWEHAQTGGAVEAETGRD